jgi:hypothetical protein
MLEVRTLFNHVLSQKQDGERPALNLFLFKHNVSEICDCIPQGADVRLEEDWVPMEETMDEEELTQTIREKEAHGRAVVLEMIGDLPEADVKPPENVLFICKLNPVTQVTSSAPVLSRRPRLRVCVFV